MINNKHFHGLAKSPKRCPLAGGRGVAVWAEGRPPPPPLSRGRCLPRSTSVPSRRCTRCTPRLPPQPPSCPGKWGGLQGGGEERYTHDVCGHGGHCPTSSFRRHFWRDLFCLRKLSLRITPASVHVPVVPAATPPSYKFYDPSMQLHQAEVFCVLNGNQNFLFFRPVLLPFFVLYFFFALCMT